jgi:hypothetical protein
LKVPILKIRTPSSSAVPFVRSVTMTEELKRSVWMTVERIKAGADIGAEDATYTPVPVKHHGAICFQSDQLGMYRVRKALSLHVYVIQADADCEPAQALAAPDTCLA